METTTAAPTTIDVTGLSPDVVHNLQQLVQSLRARLSPAATTPVRTLYGGKFEHERTGSWSAQDFEAARREMFGGASTTPTSSPVES